VEKYISLYPAHMDGKISLMCRAHRMLSVSLLRCVVRSSDHRNIAIRS